ncbi:MAG: helix-turn-helix transcriptional regulator [Treponema sp.]|uniref:helix-turn-helix domain-containing protein n=1 Tax=Treponema sp. TaxID=166 RepID=UPI00298DA1C5|nr:helix-turn-helix transcriptional regulator [Treponema sp.]MCQ2601499.1 helix-turn-helix transcriptional regulator [Treponema sp.]
MGFWKKVDEEIKFSGTITRKTIAAETGINIQTINRAIERDSKIYVEEAFKVAKVFGKPVEYFLEGQFIENSLCDKTKDETNSQLYLYSKHQKLISNCESLSENDYRAVTLLASTLAQKSPSYGNIYSTGR